MEYNLRISDEAKSTLNQIFDEYMGIRQYDEYGLSAFQNWLTIIKNSLQTFYKNGKLVKDNIYKSNIDYWGVIYYSKDRINKVIVLTILYFEFDLVNLYNWIVYHTAPTKSNLPKPIRWFQKKLEPICGKYHIIKKYGEDEYNLLDDSGKIMLQHWVKKIKPFNGKDPYGKYKIIAHCNDGGHLKAIDYQGNFYDLNKSWTDMYEKLTVQSLNNLLIEYMTELECQYMIQRCNEHFRNLLNS